MKKQNQFKHKINSLKLLHEKLKGLDVTFDYNEDENGHVLGMLEGMKKMNQSNKKITNQDIMNLLTKKFEDMDKRFEDMEAKFGKRFDKIDAKIDLMIQSPTMNREIDHKVLAKIDAD